MTKSNIIAFPGIPAEAPAPLPEAPSRRSCGTFGRRLVTALEAAVTAVIGLCIVTCTVAFLFLV